MYGRKPEVTEKLLELSEKDFLIEKIWKANAELKRCCCSFCGGEVILEKNSRQNSKEAELISFCTRCNRIDCATDKDLYRDRMNLLLNSAARII